MPRSRLHGGEDAGLVGRENLIPARNIDVFDMAFDGREAGSGTDAGIREYDIDAAGRRDARTRGPLTR